MPFMLLITLPHRCLAYLVLALAVIGKLTWFLWVASFGLGLYLAGLLVLHAASFRYEGVQPEHRTANSSKADY
jgi:hypothetical protein